MSVLERIVAYKREFVAESRRLVPETILRERLSAATAPRGFARALRGTRGPEGARVPQTTLRVVAEIKPASPSKGVLREDCDPAAIARSYARGGASAVSVLTDERFFRGSLRNLELAREACVLPALRKEFMIDPYQVVEARAAGADAILLIAGMIEWSAQRDLLGLARGLGMDVLMETHDEAEIDRALELGPDVLGINNRDLRSADLRTDVRRTGELIARVPDSVTLLSESGIATPEDVAYLKGLGVDGALVGERLMREEDPGGAIARLGAGVSTGAGATS